MQLLVSETYLFEKEVARLNKRAAKIGYPTIVFTKLGTKSTMKHIGIIGKRIEFVNVKALRVASYDSQFGTTFINTFEDTQGNEIVWKTGSFCAEEGKVYSFKATIKEHGEFNGAKQTVVSRAMMS